MAMRTCTRNNFIQQDYALCHVFVDDEEFRIAAFDRGLTFEQHFTHISIVYD